MNSTIDEECFYLNNILFLSVHRPWYSQTLGEGWGQGSTKIFFSEEDISKKKFISDFSKIHEILNSYLVFQYIKSRIIAIVLVTGTIQ